MDKQRIIPLDRFIFLPPKPGVCPICAEKHRPEEPHNPCSLYYQMQFYQKHGRYPTWADAMQHCNADVKKAWIQALADHGVIVELPEETANEKAE